MTARDTWDDAQRLADALNLRASESTSADGAVLPLLLDALDRLTRDELLVLRRRLDERLTG